MKPKEIKELSDVDIQEKLENEESALRKLQLDHAVSEIENPKQFKERRKNIARMKTILRERELENEDQKK